MKKRADTDKRVRVKKEWIIAIIIGLILTSFIFDNIIIKSIESIRNIFLDYIFISLSFAANVFIIFFLLTTFFLYIKPKRRWILPLWITIALSELINLILKIIIHRQRPFQEGIVSVLSLSFYFIKDNINTWDFSFPSGHAVLVFCVLPLINKEFKKLKYLWIIFACLVAFSRVYLGVHYMSDVLGGAIIGYLIGLMIIKIEEKYEIGAYLMKKLKM